MLYLKSAQYNTYQIMGKKSLNSRLPLTISSQILNFQPQAILEKIGQYKKLPVYANHAWAMIIISPFKASVNIIWHQQQHTELLKGNELHISLISLANLQPFKQCLRIHICHIWCVCWAPAFTY